MCCHELAPQVERSFKNRTKIRLIFSQNATCTLGNTSHQSLAVWQIPWSLKQVLFFYENPNGKKKITRPAEVFVCFFLLWQRTNGTRTFPQLVYGGPSQLLGRGEAKSLSSFFFLKSAQLTPPPPSGTWGTWVYKCASTQEVTRTSTDKHAHMQKVIHESLRREMNSWNYLFVLYQLYLTCKYWVPVLVGRQSVCKPLNNYPLVQLGPQIAITWLLPRGRVS